MMAIIHKENQTALEHNMLKNKYYKSILNTETIKSVEVEAEAGSNQKQLTAIEQHDETFESEGKMCENLNESLTDNIDQLIKNKNTIIECLTKANNDLRYLNFIEKENTGNNSELNSEINSEIEYNDYKEKRVLRQRNRSKTKVVSIGLSKSIKKSQGTRVTKNNYIKDISDNDYGDDDEDIVVILDEK